MKIRLFYHSLLSDWNHGNAHFLRGIVTQLQKRGHDVVVFEPEDAWSLQNLIAEHGEEPLRRFQEAYPGLSSVRYRLDTLDLEAAVADADLVIVHEWSDHMLVKRMGELRQEHPFVLLFHDTHHRLITRPQEMHGYDLSHYDGVLAYGQVLADLYLETKLARRVWTWHEAADKERFQPKPETTLECELVCIRNRGHDERT